MMTNEALPRPTKPLGRKAYGSIGHLPQSRMGPADHHVHSGQAAICIEKVRDKHDEILVQEKLDGSCVAVVKLAHEVVALGRAGYLAETSPFEQHHLFAEWVAANRSRFDFLHEDERVVGEWLAQAHGTRYSLPHEPFVAFDIMSESNRLPFDEFMERTDEALTTPALIHRGGAFSLLDLQQAISSSRHGALDPVEGAVYRVQRKGAVDFLAKWVRPDKVDGCYLPEVSGRPAIWNWRP